MSRTSSPWPARRWWTLGVLSITQLMVALDATVINIALPWAQNDLGFSAGDRQWLITAYALTFGSLLLLGGGGGGGRRPPPLPPVGGGAWRRGVLGPFLAP